MSAKPWKIIREDSAYYTLDNAEKTLARYEEKQQMNKPLPQAPPVDWSKPLQTFQNPPLKARLVCDDRKSPTHKRIVLIEHVNNPDLEWIAQCEEDGNGVAVDSNMPIRIVNVPAKEPFGREDWEKLTRVRDRSDPTKSYLVGTITSDTVVVGGTLYDMEKAATLFLTMDRKKLYK